MSKHRFLTNRLLSLAVVGASLTLLAACGSPASDGSEVTTDPEPPRLPASTVSLPDPGKETLQILSPAAVEGDVSTRSFEEFTATGLTTAATKTALEQAKGPINKAAARENQGVSTDLTYDANPTATKTFEFAPLQMVFYPTPYGATASESVPFLLIWQFQGAKSGGSTADNNVVNNGKFVAPGIDQFKYTPEDDSGDFTATPPAGDAQYLERMLVEEEDGGFLPTGKYEASGPTNDSPRPIPYVTKGSPIYRPFPQNSPLSRLRISGSSTFWSNLREADGLTSEEAAAQLEAVAKVATPGDEADAGEIPKYDVELIFPKRQSTGWDLRYSGFILMRAFYKSGDLATGTVPDGETTVNGDTVTPVTQNPAKSYINLFTYTRGATDMTAILEALTTDQVKATYKSTFAAWGVARANPNVHHFFYDTDFSITATFFKSGGGTLSGTIKPRHSIATPDDGDEIGVPTPLVDQGRWGGDRTIKLQNIKWTGKSNNGMWFTGTPVVTGTSAYQGEGAEVAFKGTFAGPEAEELVGEIKLKPATSAPTSEPTILGGVSGQRHHTSQ